MCPCALRGETPVALRISRGETRVKIVSLVGLLFLAAIDASGAQAVARQDTADYALSKRWGTWSAANSNGRTFIGTWTAVPDTSGAVTGTWTLSDAQGKTV